MNNRIIWSVLACLLLQAPSQADTSAIKKFVTQQYAGELPKGAESLPWDDLQYELDKYSKTLSDEELEAEYAEVKGIMQNSCGLHLGIAYKGARILSISPQSPAYALGLRRTDVIEMVDNGYSDIVDAVLGLHTIKRKAGKTANLKLRRNKKIVMQKLWFGSYKIDPISVAVINRTLSVRIHRFCQGVTTRFISATESVDPSMIDTLVFDVRGNPGGLRDEAVELAQLFIAKGDTVAAYKFRKETTYSISAGQSKWRGRRAIYILQDENSASGSELFTGALKVRCKAVVIGTKSYGKGRMQHIVTDEQVPNLSGDDVAGMSMTVAFFLPGGKLNVDGVGIMPAIEFETPERELGELPLKFDILKWRKDIPVPTQQDIDRANALGYGNVALIIWDELLDPWLAVEDVKRALKKS